MSRGGKGAGENRLPHGAGRIARWPAVLNQAEQVYWL